MFGINLDRYAVIPVNLCRFCLSFGHGIFKLASTFDPLLTQEMSNVGNLCKANFALVLVQREANSPKPIQQFD